MDQFPPNSKKSARAPNEPKKVTRVTSAPADRRPKGIGRKFKDAVIPSDPRSVADYVFLEVVIPSVRDLLFEAGEAAWQRMIYGESTRPRRGISGTYNEARVDYTPYNRMSSGPPRSKPSSPRMLSRGSRARGSFDELIIPSRREAEEVLEQMYEILSRYGGVSVADLYELTGVQSQHTDMKWGWMELRGSKVVPLRRQGGYLLDLPAPEPLE